MINLDLPAPADKPQIRAVILAPSMHGELPSPGMLRLGGKSLLAWSLECAMSALSISEVIVLTDDPATAQAAARMGRGPKPVRVVQVQGDCASPQALTHALGATTENGLLCLLHVAAPLRASFDVDAASQLFIETLACRDEARPLSLCSVASFPRAHSLSKLRWVVRDGALDRRLDGTRAGLARYVYSFGESAPHVPNAELCSLNNAFRLLTRQTLRQWLAEPLDGIPAERLAYIMPEERSLEIENEHDLRCARAIFGLRNSTTVVAPSLAA